MADSTINGLTALTGANVDNTADQFPIWDNSANTTKKITRTELLTGIPAGTSVAPAITFTGDSNTGIYSPAADTIGLVTGGVERFRIDSASGNLLVGTTSANGSLTVVGAQSVDGSTYYIASLAANNAPVAGRGSGLAFRTNVGSFTPLMCAIEGVKENGTTDDYASALDFSTRVNGGFMTKRLRIDSTGQVGIGKTPTLGLLDVNADAYFNTVRVGLGGGAVASNTAVGNGAMAATATGTGNVAVGQNSMAAMTSGSDNTAIGRGTLQLTTTGSNNTALGRQALNVNTASDNTAVGYLALTANTSGTNNVAVGRSALAAVTTNGGNTAIGRSALAVCTAADNTALGYNAGSALTTGANNTIIGSGAAASAVGGTGQIVIGKGVTGTANNRITVGITTNIAELDLDGADTSWAASSDERLKKNVADYAAGLDVITALRPVTYQWRSRKEVPTELTNYYADSDEPVHGDASKTYHGFIAQEVKAVLDANPSVPNGQHLWEQRDDGVQTLAPADLVPILVNAIKQLSSQYQTLNAEVQALKNK